ncbi:sarcosine oxidase subunit gamma [Thalassospira marina]|uniref:Sarcosine oxidase subunit gamma n=1 Tax=Thalassospira marina TaxID=2048283 RepID=A0ABM6QGJ7_9PROT|nr:hypothetical protein [Thalassospira marina]AUG55707.1 hypothetical protein CSC3H3_22940 [Thalassospira marina]
MVKHNKLPVNGTISTGEAVTISEVATGHITQFAGWDGFEPAVNAALQSFGLSLPADYCTAVRHENSVLWRIAPNRVLLQSVMPVDHASGDDIVVLDLSDARRCVRLEGVGAAGLLARVMAIDFSASAFPVGTFVQAGMHHVGVLVDRKGDQTFDLLIPTTWTVSLCDLLISHFGHAA